MKLYLNHFNCEKETQYEVETFTTLGAGEHNDIRLEGDEVSVRHARIELKENGFFVRDLQSTQGVFVNTYKVEGEAPIEVGDIIRVGNYEFLFGDMELFAIQKSMRSRNKNWDSIVQKLPCYAKSNLPVLLLGESGTGKEVISQALHKMSSRKEKPVITVNCSALTKNLVESELFGHTRGSFTGATQDRKGAFEEARGGTLILDEVGDLPLDIQPKLLRALENHEIRPVGGDKTVKTDCRIIACTHHNLELKVHRGEFRLDLFYRLNVVQISIPPLRFRIEDFEALVFKFAKEFRVRLSNEAIDYLKCKDWPGNVRELKNYISRCRIYYPNMLISTKDLVLLEHNTKDVRVRDLKKTDTYKVNMIREIEKELILKSLISNLGNQRRAAMELGIPKSTLFDKLRSYGVNIKEIKKTI